MTKNRVLRLLALAILCVLPAFPAILTYTDLGAWQAATTQLGLTIDFSNLAPNPGNYSSALESILYADPGIRFTAPGDPSVQVNNPSVAQWWFNWSTGAVIHPFNQTNGVMRVDLTTAATAFATNMMISNNASGSSMTVTVRSGATALYTSSPLATSAHTTPTFFGVVSTDPLVTFDSIVFAPPTNLSAALDNVRVGSYNAPPPPPPPPPPDSAVPEPGTGFLALGGIGLIALGCFRKRC